MHRGGPVLMRLTLLCAVLAAAACERMPRSSGRSDTAAELPDSEAIAGQPPVPTPMVQPAAPPAPGATQVTVVEGFLTPEARLLEADQVIDSALNSNARPPAEDNNGRH